MAKAIVPNVDRRNAVAIYIREEEKPIFKRFLQYIQKDNRITALRDTDKKGVMSIAIMQLILKYVNEVESGTVAGISPEFIQRVTEQIEAGDLTD